jgi:RND family efflux transporter MFP subunit
MPVLRFPWSCCLLVFLLVAGCGSSSDGDRDRGRRGDRGDATPSVEAVQARFGALPLEERLSGRVRAADQVAIMPEIEAPVEAVLVENGDYVEKGDPLVRLRDDRYRDRVRQAESQLKIAEANAKRARATLKEVRAQLRRTERLAESNFESEQRLESLRAQVEGAEADVDEAEARVEQAEATLAERRADLRRTVVRAPFSGYAGNRNAEVGQRVSPSTQLFTMGSLDTMRVEAQVTDKMFGKIQPGQTVRLRSPSLPDTVITATVSRMSPFLSEDTYSAEIEIDVPNPGRRLTAGMYVEVDVLYGESRQATLVPKAALYENPDTGVRGVYVAPSLGSEVQVKAPDEFDKSDPPPLTQPTPTAFRNVEILAEGRQTVGVRGIEPGAWVVTVGQNLLSTSAGERVDARVRPQPWSRLMALQRLQDVDLLHRVLDRQQRLAKQRFGDSTETDSAQATAADTTSSASSLTSQR